MHTTLPNRQLKTLSRADGDFSKYLDGSFSETMIALPIRSLNVGLPSEQITFEVVSRDSVSTPSFGVIASTLARPSTLVFSIGTMWVAWMHILSSGRVQSSFLALSAFCGVLIFHVAVNLLNDYGDHMKGQDRMRPFGGSRAIQKGWVRAHTVRKWAVGLIGLSVLLGIPAALASPVIVIAAIALLIALEFAFQKLRLKARGWSEILAFAMAGPLLTCGFSWAVSQEMAFTDATLGLTTGLIALLYFHSANLENIMADSQAGASTWATRTGFEASILFFVAIAMLIPAASAFQAGSDRNVILVLVGVIQAAFLIPVVTKVRKLASPLSSDLVGLRYTVLRLAWLTVIALSAAYAATFFFGFQA
ncbi:MAG TPA: UbiA family prenyltransferase [Bdellovibrionales bacterium]|nr:UbiA family prenyltransferase [Bdellovibrionales bacterium]